MRIMDWSSDVCSSDLLDHAAMRIPPESVIADRAEIGAAVVPIIVPRPDRAIEPIAALGEQRRRRGADAVTARPIEARAHPERRYDRVGKHIELRRFDRPRQVAGVAVGARGRLVERRVHPRMELRAAGGGAILPDNDDRESTSL